MSEENAIEMEQEPEERMRQNDQNVRERVESALDNEREHEYNGEESLAEGDLEALMQHL